jgi:hypothetical protein
MNADSQALRIQVERQVAHWEAATLALADLDAFAAPAAWAALEQYLGLALRRHLSGVVDALVKDARVLSAELGAARGEEDLERLRRRVIAFRRRFIQTETVLDFYGDAVNSRTSPRLHALLRACDVLAARSMGQLLGPVGRESPPVLTYVDKGMGASILRAGLRLWDGGSLSPVAAIKVVRHNLYRPTALIHETGHQVAHLLGWNDELARALRTSLAGAGDQAADAWAGWASEVAADTFAFAHTGYGSVAALHDVVAGDEAAVFRHLPGDPHPIAYIRVLLGTAMCVRFFGAGPWDDLERAWRRAQPLERAPAATRRLLEASLGLLPAIVEICLLRPMRAFGGRSLAALVDPLRVRPDALDALEREVGAALTTSPHWLWTECLRLLALTSLRAASSPERAMRLAEHQEGWMLRLGGGLLAAAA